MRGRGEELGGRGGLEEWAEEGEREGVTALRSRREERLAERRRMMEQAEEEGGLGLPEGGESVLREPEVREESEKERKRRKDAERRKRLKECPEELRQRAPVVPPGPPRFEDQKVVAEAMMELQMRALLLARQLGLEYRPALGEVRLPEGGWSLPFDDVAPVPSPGDISYGRNDRRVELIDKFWPVKEWFWPWSAINVSDPFSPMAPMPEGWAEYLVAVTPAALLVELQYFKMYRKHSGRQKVEILWRYLFDYYPWVLPEEISRRPRWEEFSPEQQLRIQEGVEQMELGPPFR
jgi:hypothetical protein